MADDDNKHQDQFDASLPLPLEDSQQKSSPPKNQPASLPQPADASLDLIRKKIEGAYQGEPAAQIEADDVQKIGSKITLSKHQQFIYDLTNSGKPLHEIQVAWHEYYAGLPEEEKHEVWQEFYDTHQRAAHIPKPGTGMAASEEKQEELALQQLTEPPNPRPKALKKIKKLKNNLQSSKKLPPPKPASGIRSILFGLGMGLIVLVVFLFSFFNERFIAPFIQPSRTLTNAPVIAGSAPVGPNPEVIIPKINVEIPVIYNVDTINETAVENALNNGVVHYADTATPGQDGNVVIVGHSSNNIFNPGKYKFAFVLLSRLDSGDTFYLTKGGKRYTYQVYEKEIVKPNDVSVLGLTDKPATATLITCDPPGTSINRLVVIGEQIDPNPTTNAAKSTNNQLATESAIIPGNAPSLWSRFWKWLSY